MPRELPIAFYNAVYRVVRAIPKGRVMTYGQIAAILGMPRAARAVGFAMRMSENKRVPWQRVINHKGGISARGDVDRPALQRVLLEKEGVKFNASECCDLRIYRWEPPDPEEYLYGDAPDLPFK
ncbi:MAG TPA: methylated-DNA--[protein]-cysteine S-methyltransferase [Candidatus Hydrogenedentes bacterium]|nr:methylated-DNA--[protein]-cysteine S-methyltransferase [Candidatus Hydrogenedentota bacterium]HRK33682.1 methylated-DNA--[protein]-cysteine S-methyltransferase [Candidatus Hydrogenedentota bacterium]